VDRGEERGHVDTRRCSRTMYTRVVLAATRLHRTFLNLKLKVLRLLKSFFFKFLVCIFIYLCIPTFSRLYFFHKSSNQFFFFLFMNVCCVFAIFIFQCPMPTTWPVTRPSWFNFLKFAIFSAIK